MKIHRITRWSVEAVIASAFKVGRVLRLGDAAHRHPPTGGLGLTSAIPDAQSLCWKVTAVLNGSAPPALLDTYEAERRPVDQRNCQRSLENAVNHFAIGSELGYGYNSAAVVRDGTPAPVQLDDIRIYEPSTRPGAPLPHGWIDDEDGSRRPIEDLVIPGRFLLIAGENGQAWCEAARDSLPRPNFRSTRCGSVTSTAISTTRAACGCASARSHLTAQSSYARTGSLRGDTRPRPRTRGRRSRLRSARSSCIPPRHPSARRCEACDERSRKTSDDRSPGWLSE